MSNRCNRNHPAPPEMYHIYYLDGILENVRPLEDHTGFLGLWVEDGTSFLFFSNRADRAVHAFLEFQPQISLIDTYEITPETWHGDKIRPFCIENIHVCPPWEPVGGKEEPGRMTILLDPGVVFGTGRHSTTEDCLVLLAALCKKNAIRSVLDIGTGTGILSLSAAALGCRRVAALDFNRLAVQTALKNVRLNDMADRVICLQARGEQMTHIRSDLLIANIHYDIMKLIVDTPGFLEKRFFILSGLLNAETQKIISRLESLPVRIIQRRCPDGVWNTLFGRSLAGPAA